MPTDDTASGSRPNHVAIIMDGNGRWARQQNRPRVSGHRAGVGVLRQTVEYVAQCGITALTVFAFSSENWRRPGTEVRLLMELFMKALQQEVERLHANNVRLRFIGDREKFSDDLQQAIAAAEQHTVDNTGLQLNIAANYGGRQDIIRAFQELMVQVQAGSLAIENVDEAAITAQLSLAGLPEPDLLIRTGGEQRISNFLLWQSAYTELYFTDTLWPDFSAADFDTALAWFAQRQRRFGSISDKGIEA
ncbi:MAG: isoprenyl transferase [Gammaproteobacteria bacterium]